MFCCVGGKSVAIVWYYSVFFMMGENWGIWAYVYAGSVVLYVYFEQRLYTALSLHICSVVGNCDCIGACG